MSHTDNPDRKEVLSDKQDSGQSDLSDLIDKQGVDEAAINPPHDATAGAGRDESSLMNLLVELSNTVEQLQVAHEEIQHQNEELQRAYILLEEERQRYRELFDHAPEAYLLTDVYGIIQEANYTASELLNTPAHMLAGKPLAIFMSSESRQAFYRFLVAARDLSTRKVGEFKLKPRHRAEIETEFTVLTTRDGQGMPATQRWIIRDIAHRKLIESELDKSRKQLQLFASNVQTAREEERMRVARDIHDELGQTLTALRLDIGMAQKQVPADMTELHDKLAHISETVVNTIQSVRRIMTDLRPSVLDEAGLIAAMEWQCRDFKVRTGIHCRLMTQETQLDLDAEIINTLFRLTQEMLTNVAKHSGASRVTIILKQDKQWVHLEVRDNGRGITDDEINNQVTSGLLGMFEQVRLLHGDIHVRGVPKRGTRIRIRLPKHFEPATHSV